jgi:Rrf2 family protein
LVNIDGVLGSVNLVAAILRVVKLSARGDYAIRAAVELAAAGDRPLKADAIARAQQIPASFLENILGSLRRADLVHSRRGADGGHRLARPPAEVTLADVVRAAEGPLAAVRGERPETLTYDGTAEPLREVWVAVRASLREVLESVTLADVVARTLPAEVEKRIASDEAWRPH